MNIFKNIWLPRSLVVVHLEFTNEGCSIFASKNSVGKFDQKLEPEKFDSLELVIKKFGSALPYVLHIDGVGVLTRLVEFLPGFKDLLIVNGDKDEFYFCTFNDSYQVGVSFFRKKIIEESLLYLKEKKIRVFDITCGIIPILLIHSNDNLEVNYDHTILIENGRIKELKRKLNSEHTTHSIELQRKKRIDVTNAICLSHQIESQNFSGGENLEYINTVKTEYSQFSKFRFFGLLSVAVILFSLIGNYFYLNHLNSQIAHLEIDLQLNNDNESLLERLKQEKTRKEQLMLTSGLNSSQFISFYIDKIGETVPSQISLSELSIFPLKEKLKQKMKVEVDQKTIQISGFTPNSQILDDWMEKMNRFEWVKSVELINYLKLDGTKAEFKLLISLAA